MSEFIAVLVCVLFVVTLIGHGIWVLMAALLRKLTGAKRDPQLDRQEVARQEVHRLLQQGLISDDLYQQLVAAMNAETSGPELASNQSSAAAEVSPEHRRGASIEQPPPVTPTPSGTPPAGHASEPRVFTAELVDPGTEPAANKTVEPPNVPEPTPVRSAAERVRRYAEHREAAAAGLDGGVPPPTVERRTWNEWLGAFMEEKNIRWGELVGGLLIVSCSIALVISFWSSIAENAFLKFGVLNGVTASLFGFGLHIAHKWRLPSTSQGILITSTLLVPLNFLAIAAFSESASTLNAVALSGEALSILLLGTLVYFASRCIAPGLAAVLTAGVMIPAVNQLLLRRHVATDSPLAVWYGFALIGFGSFVVTQFLVLNPLRRQDRVEESQAISILKQLGITLFSVVVGFGLLLVKTEQAAEAISWLSPLWVLIAVPLLVAGVSLWQRPGTTATGLQMVGSCLAVASALLTFGGIFVAWPQPVLIVAIALACMALYSIVAEHWRLPELHAVAATFAALAGVTAYHVLAHNLTWTVETSRQTFDALISAASGHVLAASAIALLLVGLGFRKRGRAVASQAYQIVAAAAAVACLLLVGWFGAFRQGDPQFVTGYLAFYGLLTMWAAAKYNVQPLMFAGGGLLLASLLHGTYYSPHPFTLQQPAITALLSHATIMAMIVGWTRIDAKARQRGMDGPATNWVIASSTVAAIASAAPLVGFTSGLSAGNVAWLSLVWLWVAWQRRSTAWFTAFQIALVAALMTLIHQRIQLQAWFDEALLGWLHPRILQWQAIGLGGFSILWALGRIGWHRYGGQNQLLTDWLKPRSLTVDRVAVHIALLLLVGLTVYGLVPGIAQELVPRQGPDRVVRAAEDFQVFDFAGSPPQRWLTWCLLLAVIAAYGLHAIHHYGRQALTGAAIATAMIPLLLSMRWEAEVAVASATRWNCAIYFLLVSAVMWGRKPILRTLGRFQILQTEHQRRRSSYGLLLTLWLSMAPVAGMVVFVAIAALGLEPPSPDEWETLRWLACIALAGMILFLVVSSTQLRQFPAGLSAAGSLLVLSAMPIAAMTLFVVGQSLARHPVTGPEPDSLFVRAGLAVSYAVPLGLLSMGFIGHAVHLRSNPVAFAAGMLIHVSATAAYLLTLRSGELPPEQWVSLSLINSVVASFYALGWLGLLIYLYPSTLNRQLDEVWLRIQRSLGVGFLALPIVGFSALLWWQPTDEIQFAAVGGWLGWSALLLVIVVLVTRQLVDATATGIWVPLWLVWLFLPLAALQSHAWEVGASEGSWLAYHAMQVGFLIGGLVTIAQRREWLAGLRSQTRLPEFLPVAALIFWGLRGIGDDPGMPWWPIMALLSASALGIELGARTSRQRYLTVSAVLINISFSLWWFEIGYRWTRSTDVGLVRDFFGLNALALALPIPLWICCTRRIDMTDWRARRGWLPLAAGWTTLLLVALCVASGLIADLYKSSDIFDGVVTALVLSAAGYASVAMLWSRRRQAAMAMFYATGLICSGAFLDAFDLEPQAMLWISTSVLSAYGLVVCYIWSYRARLSALAHRLRLPEPVGQMRTEQWLVPLSVLLTVLVCVLGHWAQFTCDYAGIRVAASQAILVQVWALALLAHGSRRVMLRYTALWVGVIGAIAFGWSWLDPHGPSGNWLNRCVMLSAALMTMAVFYAIGLAKVLRRENDWTMAAEKLVPSLVGLGCLSIAGVLTAEGWLFVSQREVAMAWPAIVAVSAALLAASAACLVAAIVPGRDPFGLTDKQRTVYVYAAEIALVLLLFHLRMTMPYLFTGFFKRYWTLVVMLVAFLGVGLSEWCRRRRQDVLGDPLEKTSMLLPLVPLMGFWISDQAMDYSLLLFAASGLYAALSIMRKSFGIGVLATLAANGGLWYFLQTSAEIRFYVHPQLWLIPPAVCVLVAAYWNREQLNQTQMTTIRYLSTSVIYVASTADVFLNGVGEAPWLPVILAGLSIAGILAGMLLQVRAFLFMGMSFLVVSLMTVIWYAAVDLQRTWIWYVTGLVAGIIVFAVFAVFERKRQQILGVLDQLKSWEA